MKQVRENISYTIKTLKQKFDFKIDIYFSHKTAHVLCIKKYNFQFNKRKFFSICQGKYYIFIQLKFRWVTNISHKLLVIFVGSIAFM